MIRRKSLALLPILVFWLTAGMAGTIHAWPRETPQTAKVESGKGHFDALESLRSSFPNSITLKSKGHLLEFCPDNTCHGFISSSAIPPAKLKDFAYLYIYYFSEYIYLPDWRAHAEAKNAAERILSRPEFRKCKSESDRQTARCILLDLSRHGRIRLIFIRYDENRRNVVPEDIAKALSQKPSGAQ